MARRSPIAELHERADAAMLPYAMDSEDPQPVDVVETYGEVELEYAAIRKGCLLIDQPQRATIEVTGDDRRDFLNRMLTQKLDDLEPGMARPSFWLSRKGRIDADMWVVEHGDRMLIDLDIHAVERTLETLGGFTFAEDIELRDATDEHHRFALHGPTGPELLSELATDAAPVAELADGRAAMIKIAGKPIAVERRDTAGAIGLELTTRAEDARALYEVLLSAGHAHGDHGHHREPTALSTRVRLRPGGWFAYNMARVEAGTPLYYMDFGPKSLPHETSIIRQRIRFDKGCYLGQEVVARMESVGHPKQRLVALDLGGDDLRLPDGLPRQPVTGSPIYTPDKVGSTPMGGVTSSVISPILGATPICFAMLRWSLTEPGTKLAVPAEGAVLTATVRESLKFID
ncbi:MAG: hypothetical protein AAF747_01620 [Planctomycetota bacterium]